MHLQESQKILPYLPAQELCLINNYVLKKKHYKGMKKKEDFCRESNHFLKSLGLALCLVSFGGSAIYASSLYAQRTMLSIQMNDRTVEDVFEYIEKNSEFIFVYHGSNIDLHRKVNLDVRDQSVEIILDKLFSGTDIEYIINNRQIIVRRDTKKEDLPIANQQTKKVKITGVVKDAHGDPVIGANVVEKGTTNGTISDLDGNFSLDVSAGNVLMVSYVGFQEKEVPVGDKKVLQIVLDEDSKALEEVVVTALGITRSEKALGYATQKFKGDELEKVKGVNIATSLSGRISGMRVYNSTEFGVAPKIKLRGEEPLVVVDGVPTNQAFSDFNQDVIENITVLKGATASALYGSRGGNGAIMITTKKGGDKGFSIEVNTSNMFNAGQLKIPEAHTTTGRQTEKHRFPFFQFPGVPLPILALRFLLVLFFHTSDGSRPSCFRTSGFLIFFCFLSDYRFERILYHLARTKQEKQTLPLKGAVPFDY